jgi:hypothetical protein
MVKFLSSWCNLMPDFDRFPLFICSKSKLKTKISMSNSARHAWAPAIQHSKIIFLAPANYCYLKFEKKRYTTNTVNTITLVRSGINSGSNNNNNKRNRFIEVRWLSLIVRKKHPNCLKTFANVLKSRQIANDFVAIKFLLFLGCNHGLEYWKEILSHHQFCPTIKWFANYF